jgi:hypothetical protein
MTTAPESFGPLSDDELDALIRQAVAELTARGTTRSFGVLIELSAHLGTSIGEAARRLAERGSWSQVAQVSGTSKQAAWSRWR